MAAQRQGRLMLRGTGLTPARFDLMHAVGHRGMKQSDLWRRLNVVRSVVCEMVRALERLGWVERRRSESDARTWIVRLTPRGREIFERAYDFAVEGGDATACFDLALAEGHVEVDSLALRTEHIQRCNALMSAFGTRNWFRGPDLYLWDPEDYYFMLVYGPNDPLGPNDVPWVTQFCA